MMPEKNDDAAPFAAPGRTQIVGNRSDSPSRKPFREKSATINSPIAFCAP